MDATRTLGDLVAANPAAAEVFRRHGLDFCCGGKQSLSEACQANGLDPRDVLREIDATEDSRADARGWETRSLPDLVRHILDRYHAPLRRTVPGLIALARRVEQAHAGKPDRPAGLAGLLSEVRVAVENHLDKEERILFPLILSGHGHGAHVPVQAMITEHEDHGKSLARIRSLANGYRVPPHACASWRELYRALEELEADLMEHIHLENHVLFPRALVS